MNINIMCPPCHFQREDLKKRSLDIYLNFSVLCYITEYEEV